MAIHLDDKGRHIEVLATRVRTLQEGAADSGASDDYDELWRIIHLQGYTTPVQLRLIEALLHAAEQNVVQGAELRIALVEGSRAIVEEFAQVSV